MDDTTEFAEVYDRYFSKIYNYVRYCVKLPQAADDVTAGIFEQALDKFGTYDAARGPVQVWLFGIARNAVTDWFRRQTRRSEIFLEDIEEQSGFEPEIQAIMEKKEENKRLIEAVSALDSRSRDIIALKFSSGMTNREISQLTGMEERNVGIIVYRAVKRLQVLLGVRERYERKRDI